MDYAIITRVTHPPAGSGPDDDAGVDVSVAELVPAAAGDVARDVDAVDDARDLEETGGPARAGAGVSRDAELSAGAAALVADALAPNTQRAYRRWVTRWDTWCAATGRTPLPGSAQALASFVAELAGEGLAPSSITQAIGAVRSAHELAGHPDTPGKGPAAKALRAHRRHQADAGRRARKAAPLTIDRLHQVVDDLDPTRAIDARDRALLVLGFAGCLRRATLVALDRDDLEEHRDRLAVTIRRSKTDQDALGRVVELPYGTHEATCPVRTLAAWCQHLDDAGHTDGAVFRPVDKAGRIHATRLTDHSASAILTRRAAAAGLTAGQVAGQASAQFTGHSLRAGGATSMADVGATTAEIAEHGGWSPRSAVVHEYVRRTEAWRRNAMRSVL